MGSQHSMRYATLQKHFFKCRITAPPAHFYCVCRTVFLSNVPAVVKVIYWTACYVCLRTWERGEQRSAFLKAPKQLVKNGSSGCGVVAGCLGTEGSMLDCLHGHKILGAAWQDVFSCCTPRMRAASLHPGTA